MFNKHQTIARISLVVAGFTAPAPRDFGKRWRLYQNRSRS